MTGLELREIRKHRLGLTQKQLAALLGVSSKSISRAENCSDELRRERSLAMLAVQVLQLKVEQQRGGATAPKRT